MFSLDKMKPAFGGMYSIVSALLTFCDTSLCRAWMDDRAIEAARRSVRQAVTSKVTDSLTIFQRDAFGVTKIQ
jgi:hypothetical protein